MKSVLQYPKDPFPRLRGTTDLASRPRAPEGTTWTAASCLLVAAVSSARPVTAAPSRTSSSPSSPPPCPSTPALTSRQDGHVHRRRDQGVERINPDDMISPPPQRVGTLGDVDDAAIGARDVNGSPTRSTRRLRRTSRGSCSRRPRKRSRLTQISQHQLTLSPCLSLCQSLSASVCLELCLGVSVWLGYAVCVCCGYGGYDRYSGYATWRRLRRGGCACE